MLKLKSPAMQLLLVATSLIVGARLLADPTPQKPLVLRVWPNQITARFQQAILIDVALQNTDKIDDKKLRTWYIPVPMGATKTDLHTLFVRCRNIKTNKEAHYTGFPPANPVDRILVEPTDTIPAGFFIGKTIDIAQFYDLPPGDYILELQHDTTYIPSNMKADETAWHGATDIVSIKIHIKK